MRINELYRPGTIAGAGRGASPTVLVLFILLLIGGEAVVFLTFSLALSVIAGCRR